MSFIVLQKLVFVRVCRLSSLRLKNSFPKFVPPVLVFRVRSSEICLSDICISEISLCTILPLSLGLLIVFENYH